jgi:uncharacterized protein (TIGR00730 family)
MKKKQCICVYCGTQQGHNPQYVESATVLGRLFVEQNLDLVYGGASVGVMGALARGVLEAGGHVTGIIPQFLNEQENVFPDISKLIITQSMHERKNLMFNMADGFVALPGGIGTLEELVEMLTWHQIGQHRKLIVLGNISGFWNPLIELIAHMSKSGFITKTTPVTFDVAETPQDIVDKLCSNFAQVQSN